MKTVGRRALLWLVPFFLTLHNLEELAGLPTAVSDLAGLLPSGIAARMPPEVFPPGPRQYLFMLLVVTVLPYLFAFLPAGRRPRDARTVLLSIAQMVMFINVFSHLGMAALTGSYVPGLVTALAFNLLFSLFFFSRALRDHWLAASDLLLFVLFALLIHGPGLFILAWITSKIPVLQVDRSGDSMLQWMSAISLFLSSGKESK